MWVERCASGELFLFKSVGGILYVFISILDNLSVAFASDEGCVCVGGKGGGLKT